MRAVRALVERQHGVASRRQLLAAGLTPKQIDSWVAARRLVAVHRGVYALSQRLLDPHGRWMAALLAIGADAVLSHRSAGALWRVHSGPDTPVELTTRRRPKARLGLLLHCLPFETDEVTEVNGIRTTTPSRTLFDLAGTVSTGVLEQAMREADYLQLWTGPSLPALVERYPLKTGARAIRQLLDRGWSAAPTRSELEARFSAFIDEYGLPCPERNSLIELGDRHIEVDFLWRDAKLIAELDGHAAHRTRKAFEDDRERDRQLKLSGFDVTRITWRQLHRQPSRLAADLRRLIATGAAIARAADLHGI